MKKKALRKAPGIDESIRLEPVTGKDVALWRAMREDLYSGLDDSFHERDMAWILGARDRACLLVKARDNTTLGFMELSLRNIVDGCIGGPVGYIEGIYLREDFRGIGLGPAMIDHAAAWFRVLGCADMATDTEVDNEAAQEFWSECGFEETWSVVQYRKSLGPPPAAPAGKPRAKKPATRSASTARAGKTRARPPRAKTRRRA